MIKKIKKFLASKKRLRSCLARIIRPKFIYLMFPRVKPISKHYGIERGGAIDRYYIEKFLKKNKQYIKGNCLEVLDNEYTLKYGSNITKSDILDIERKNAKATIYGDIRNLKEVPDESFDCIILTQVLQFIDDYQSAIATCHRVLKKNGVLLATLPSVSRVDCVAGENGDYWRFTKASAEYIFSQSFKKPEIISFGNVKVGSYFLIGLSVKEISKNDLDRNDPNFPCIITIMTKKYDQ